MYNCMVKFYCMQEGTVTQLAHRAIEDYRLNKTDTINAVDLIQAQVLITYRNDYAVGKI